MDYHFYSLILFAVGCVYNLKINAESSVIVGECSQWVWISCDLSDTHSTSNSINTALQYVKSMTLFQSSILIPCC